MKAMKDLWQVLCRERPTGTAANAAINDYLEAQLVCMGYTVESLSFDCFVWQKGPSYLDTGSQRFAIRSCPFSEGFLGSGNLALAETLSDLECADYMNSVLILAGKLTEAPLMPKEYPFYYPSEHKYIVDLLESKSPKAIVALTGRHPMCGLDPFPLFEDGNFRIPVGYSEQSLLSDLKEFQGEKVTLTINSQKIPAKGRQLVATKSGERAREKIVIGAHMDTKYQTPGALDNAAGVAVMLEIAKRLTVAEFSVDIVPFNGEEYYAACGELAYIEYLKQRGETVRLMVNIDSPCYEGSPAAVSYYNMDARDRDSVSRVLTRCPAMVDGDPWYAGDHAAFAFSGTPCIAVTTMDLDRALALTHTLQDTMENINQGDIIPVADAVVGIMDALFRSDNRRGKGV
jgi:aminopeptidase YwaD